jgi:GntR family transcriptional regulator
MSHFPFQRLQTDLAQVIADTPAGARLPSEPALALQMGVSRATLREAMRTFETQGLIRRRQGSGTYVVGGIPLIEGGLEVLESMNTIAQRINLSVKVATPVTQEFPADETLAGMLGVPLGSALVRVSRIMRADSRPVAYLMDTLPSDVLSTAEWAEEFNGSVLDYLLQRGGDPLTLARTEVSAIGAPADVAKRLEVQRGDVLLQFTSQLYTASGTAVAYSLSYFLPGYFRFHVVRKVGGRL